MHKQQLQTHLYSPRIFLFISCTNTDTQNPPIEGSYIWVYPLPVSISINHSPRNCSPSRHTQAHRQQNSDTLHCRRIDYQCGFYWRVWGADTSALGLLILLSYPNEPCVIHHCSAGSTQDSWEDWIKEGRGLSPCHWVYINESFLNTISERHQQ